MLTHLTTSTRRTYICQKTPYEKGGSTERAPEKTLASLTTLQKTTSWTAIGVPIDQWEITRQPSVKTYKQGLDGERKSDSGINEKMLSLVTHTCHLTLQWNTAYTHCGGEKLSLTEPSAITVELSGWDWSRWPTELKLVTIWPFHRVCHAI